MAHLDQQTAETKLITKVITHFFLVPPCRNFAIFTQYNVRRFQNKTINVRTFAEFAGYWRFKWVCDIKETTREPWKFFNTRGNPNGRWNPGQVYSYHHKSL